jgi:Na+-transporting methylmalonyl-CoA/oxaloacetate decarboxylase gamma subunit
MIDMSVGATIILVFALIVILLVIFRFFGNLMLKKETEAEIAAMSALNTNAKKNASDDEVGAAIAMALYLYTNQLHDQENPVITMIKVSRTYSPWSSKIYGLRKSPR